MQLPVGEVPGEDPVWYDKRDSFSVPTVCSISFLIDGYSAGILSRILYDTLLPGFGD